MGRGAPSKVGGIISNKDYRPRLFVLGKNVSILQFFQHGCFEKDLMTYCANRLSDYSCIHWVDENAENIDQDLLAMDSTENGTCITINLSHFPNLQIATQYLLPIFIFMAVISSIFVLIIMNKLSSFHPLCSYLAILAGFDLVELFVQGGDLVFEAFFNIKIVSAIQFLNRSACQILPLIFNVLKQGQSALYIGLAVDNCRFITETRKMSLSYKKEWISNVCILSSVLILTMNAQFFWTFDVTENDNKFLHERMVKRSFECGFSTTLPPNPNFAHFIWPLFDHLAGEILPFFIGIGAAVFGFVSIRKQFKMDPCLIKVSLDLPLIQQTNTGFVIIGFCHSIVTFIRLCYYITKYCIFLSLSNLNLTNFRGNPVQNQKFAEKINQFKVENSETVLEMIEYIIKISNMALILIKFIVLTLYLENFKIHMKKWMPNLSTFSKRPKRNLSFPSKHNFHENINLISFSI